MSGNDDFDPQLAERLKAYREATKDLQAPARLETQLRAAFRQGQWRKESQVPTRWRLWAAVGLAACLVIAGGVAWVLNWGEVEPPAAVVQSLPPAPEALWALKKSSPVGGVARGAVPRAGARAPGGDPKLAGQAGEAATDFIVVTHPATWPDAETRQLLRVQMPRMAAAALGVPVNAERAEEMIRADVVVGQDGVVRAIRFVQ